MAQTPDRPREYDAVRGGAAPPGAVVLGGLEGVKRRFATAGVEARIAAVYEALKYEDAGLDVAIAALKDESEQVQEAAYRLLRDRTEPRVKQALREYNPWQLMRCLCTLNGHSDLATSVAISPDGLTLVSGSADHTIKLWDLPCDRTKRLKRTLEGHSDSVLSVCISPDGQTIVSASRDTTIKVWNLHAGTLQCTLKGHLYSVNSLAISSDSEILVSGSYDNTIKIWHLPTGQLIRTLYGHSFWINALAISPDNLTAISGSHDKTIKVWDLGKGELIRSLEGHSNSVDFIAISPDGQRLISGSYNIYVWDLSTGKLERIIEYKATAAAISKDWKIIVSGRGAILDLQTGKIAQLKCPFNYRHSAAAISPDGKTFVLCRGNSIHLWGVPPSVYN